MTRLVKFTKMHGLGNDYVYVDCFEQQISDPARAAVVLADRHFGVGGDGLIMICPSRPGKKCRVKMRIFNADGSEAQMCGNGLRCVAKFACERGLIRETDFLAVPEPMQRILEKVGAFDGDGKNWHALPIETGRGVLTVAVLREGDGKVSQVCVNMDQPILKPELIPVDLPGSQVLDVSLTAAAERFSVTCVSMGNPHAVIFCNNLEDVPLRRCGPALERHEAFKERTNVHFVQVIDRSTVKMVTWERGSGMTLACGTGASAVCVAGALTDRTDRNIEAHLPGGTLKLAWSEIDNCVYMIGPATEVFSGEIDLEALLAGR